MPDKSEVLKQNAPGANFVMEGKSLYNRRSKPMDVVLKLLINGVIFLCMVVLIGVLDYTLVNGLGHVGWQFLSISYSKTKADLKGILPMAISTLYTAAITLLIAVSIGTCSAIYLVRHAKQDKLVKAIRFTTEILSGIPPILFGLSGYTVSCILFWPQTSILTGCLTATPRTLPVIVCTAEESPISVLSSYKEGALALSVDKLRMILGVVLPYVIPDVLMAVIFIMGRTVGESTVLSFISDLAHQMPKGFSQQIFNSDHMLTLHLYQTVREATTPGTMSIVFAIALVLLTLVLLLSRLAGFSLKAL